MYSQGSIRHYGMKAGNVYQVKDWMCLNRNCAEYLSPQPVPLPAIGYSGRPACYKCDVPMVDDARLEICDGSCVVATNYA